MKKLLIIIGFILSLSGCNSNTKDIDGTSEIKNFTFVCDGEHLIRYNLDMYGLLSEKVKYTNGKDVECKIKP